MVTVTELNRAPDGRFESLEATDTINTADILAASEGQALKKAASGSDLEFGSAGLKISDLVTDAWLINTMFESLDGWKLDFQGSGQKFYDREGLALVTGSTQGSYAQIFKDPSPSARKATWDKNRYMAFGYETYDFKGPKYIISGDISSTNFTREHIGIKINNGNLLGTVGNASTETTTVLQSSPTSGKHQATIEYISGSEVKFTIDGTQEGSITSNLPSSDDFANYFGAYIGNGSTTNDITLNIADIRMVQES